MLSQCATGFNPPFRLLFSAMMICSRDVLGYVRLLRLQVDLIQMWLLTDAKY